ncbi:sensor histidine kinase [Vibrio gazogenes]|uniref:histidine kinase n=1 Tax=Vibrio gazogenes DSM 21264 = NBRC 103151 TaxID=1123492 RepID=A0A1M5AWE0_VIBGA|nr:ATP-binding protein [Vibrio gazogenes]USP12738.1 ATP-binding protein [Vibrio gazogenes]SHF34530.1 His Kinase A (phospho-acceptor) domain-containing protein [Vibrio gazogenes DSM 21264] [Vibrio gazogenes DSM 21264 = NBRC 103151]SJN57469.1 Sensor protein ZraS [Vibrio gazogenes]
MGHSSIENDIQVKPMILSDEDRWCAEPNFALDTLRLMLTSESQDDSLDLFVDFMSETFVDTEIYLFTTYELDSLRLIRSRPLLTGPIREQYFPTFTQHEFCFIEQLERSNFWAEYYAPFFPTISKALVVTVQIQSRHYMMLLTSQSEALWQQNSLGTLHYIIEVVKIALTYITSTEMMYHNQDVEQTEKLASLGKLAAGVAHEINNPLGFIMSNLGTLSAYMREFKQFVSTLSETQKISVEEILDDSAAIISETLEGLTRIQNVVSSLNVYNHVSSSNIGVVDLRDVISSSLGLILGELKMRARIDYQAPERPMYVKGQSNKLQQAFIHLIMNAFQSITHTDGIICIRLTYETSVLIPRKRNLCLSIQDNGKGISEEHLRHIFEPFFTTKQVGSGAGLGLSVAKEIIEEHSGLISIESELGKGTQAVIRLPCVVSMP